jgi:hypothetical protein
MALQGHLGMQVEGYRAMLHSELTSGSMSAGNRELMDVGAQILSLDSLAGFYAAEGPVRSLLVISLLGAVAVALAWISLRNGAARRERYTLLAAWCGLGLLATYHRAHDALVLLLVLPWLFDRLCACWRDAVSWVSLATLAGMSIAPRWETWQAMATHPALNGVSELMLYRQAPCAALLLVAILIGSVAGARQESAVGVQANAGASAIRA